MGNETTSTSRKTEGGVPLVTTPIGTRWREFRVRFLPLLVFSATLIGIWQLWQDLPAGGIRGIGDGAVSMLASPQDGFIQTEVVAPFGWVEAGEPIVSITPFDPAAKLDMFQSRLQVARFGLEPSVSERTALDYERLRVDSLRLKQELAMAKANLDLATKILPRHEALLKENLISRDIYDTTVRDRDLYRAEVEEKTRAIKEIDTRLEVLRSMTEPGAESSRSPIAQRLPELEEQLLAIQTNWNPVVVQAPISGEVQFIRRAGEFVRAGEPILTINSPRAERVIAYLKQPFPFEPAVGMQMEVVTRSLKPKRYVTSIARVGARVEVLTNALAYVPAGSLVDTGLPVILPVPAEAEVKPGEIVDVIPLTTAGSFFAKLFRSGGATP